MVENLKVKGREFLQAFDPVTRINVPLLVLSSMYDALKKYLVL